METEQQNPNDVPLIKREFLLQANTGENKIIYSEIPNNVDSNTIKRSNDEFDGEEEIDNNKPSKIKNEKKKIKGINRNRRKSMHENAKQIKESNFISTDTNKPLCRTFVRDNFCRFGSDCTFSHRLDLYERQPDIDDHCPNFAYYGKCDYGILCRFGSNHLTDNVINVVDEKRYSQNINQSINQISKELQVSLRKKQYDFTLADSYSRKIQSSVLKISDAKQEPRQIKLRKRIDFDNKLYLAPLTTLGNLPFRRICKEFGADITCSEMALSQNILQGCNSEWALLRRHPTENLFGVQICGSSVDQLARCAQLISQECDVDFIDLNMGCPIDLIYQKGGGSALMERPKKLDSIIYSVSSVSNVPITLKMRTGVYAGKNNAHNLISDARRWRDNRIGLITVHGRSREQRYTKLADWDYIAQCNIEAKKFMENSDPIPLFGSGDILSYEEYYERLQSSNVSGIMIARGALIKPWIFTEIIERKTLDISSQERFDILKKFVNYGLCHWGSDEKGVEKTRLFLLEWLSFLYRYIPVGLMERLPQRINERPPKYFGRNDLETLMSSPCCDDWITISEMLLGKVQDNFKFIPKHKANAYR
ncbi:tRNA-dihydrouridine(47) synthase [NAD(P)(+)]-like [Sarcoptes scabiei]|uniref:tRNA-dihydrouridine(47) synthase [NAD(P)(+)] n=1 Tax=Sarcoptes scabiei TaxID=52283 RepID=A0A834VC95_SARSC|nr:tRNA-dihydrouridine(47) synthase [NAD(P)(+)]-like [Sarcoptes scabiei]UXI17376.1 hypothetical protein NH340_JMT03319 [Sarcoptes scabiei]